MMFSKGARVVGNNGGTGNFQAMEHGEVLRVSSDRKIVLVQFDKPHGFNYKRKLPEGDPYRTLWMAAHNLELEKIQGA